MAGAIVISEEPGPERATGYGWLVFAISFGLLMSDHMARQVLGAVSPLLKAEWQLSDKELGALSSVVAIAVGLLSFPLSLAADRFGRVRSLFAMATLWSLATLGGAFAQSYLQLLAARVLVGVGEAAYGSVGIAVVLAVFPRHLRATLSSSFLAGSVFGQIVGVSLGGAIAASHGWRTAFELIGLFGLVLAIAYPLIVRESRLGTRPERTKLDWGDLGRSLFGSRLILLCYFASGIQLYCTGALAFWLPSLLKRYYAMDIATAGRTTGLFLLVCAAGMISTGILADRAARRNPALKPKVALVYSLLSAGLFGACFFAPPGKLQLALLAASLLPVAGVAGVAGAMVANLTPSRFHGTAMAMLALANNLLGLAPGPYFTGLIADRSDLLTALKVLPIPCLLCAGALWLVRAPYAAAVRPPAAP